MTTLGITRAPWREFLKLDDQFSWMLIAHGLQVKNFDGYHHVTVICPKSRKRKAVSRIVTNCPDGFVVDHINGDTLDNRFENLRICTRADNARNCGKRASLSSSYKGVRKMRSKWQAQITVNYRTIYLGTFGTEVEAASAYDQAARQYYGDYAALNFPNDDEQTAHRPLSRNFYASA